ncbi:MAG: response regulator transcription factor [Daejeonella sp.]|uniref:LytR/AlgR family response regulator transcription factor n=1 Tax=Daejeonella sp. TaxID=2805397 RepID=UPI0027347775|nr:response regulator transcription factor [Daejeonella sp.]MDP3469561.1 response regulator transcription factor [Daejeonella sp.]
MSNIRIIAVEDDPLHEEKLRMNIEKLGYTLVSVVCTPEEVLPAVTAIAPDIILMDIDLSHQVSGIDLVESINDRFDIPVVFLTSFIDNRTFQQAKKTSPAAYVTKPYKLIELQSAIELALTNKQKASMDILGATEKGASHFFIKEGTRLTKIAISDVLLVEAYDKYCRIYTSGKTYTLRVKMKDILLQLPSSEFCRTHRSFIVSLNAIVNVDVSTGKISIADKKIPVSKSFKNNFLIRLRALG